MDEMRTKDVSPELNHLSFQVIGAALDVQRELGVGLMEKTYRIVLADELRTRGLDVAEEVRLPIHFRGRIIDHALRLDLLVNRSLVVELKAQSRLGYADQAQLLTYLTMTGCELGLLINFNELPLGIKRSILTPRDFASFASFVAENGQQAPKPSSPPADSPT